MKGADAQAACKSGSDSPNRVRKPRKSAEHKRFDRPTYLHEFILQMLTILIFSLANHC